MKPTEEIVQQSILEYIKNKHTDYALLITGDWGSGKTFFWDTVIEPTIKSTTGFIPVKVSLNGIDDFSQINNKIIGKCLAHEIGTRNGILEQVVNFFKSKKFKKAKEIGKLTKKFLGGRIEKALGVKLPDGISVDFLEDYCSFENKIICFDDLERAKAKIGVIWGFINDFIEQKAVKVIVIADETKLKDDSYAHVKEKVIGKTMQFIPDVETKIAALIDKYAKDDSYKQFLYNNKNTILDISVKSKVHNLRVLRNFINDFSVVYDATKSFEPHVIESMQANLVALFLAFIYEISLGNMTNVQIDKLKSLNLFKLIFRVSGKETSEEKYIDDFVNKYLYGKSGIDFYPSIIEYLISGRLDTEKFKDDIGLYKKEKPEDELLQKFLYSYWADLEDKEFEVMITNILKIAEAGNLNLTLYPVIYHRMLLINQDNILPVNLKIVKANIIKGMDKCTIINEVDSFERLAPNITSEDPDYIDIKNRVKDIRERNERIMNKEELKRVIGLINTDINAFFQEFSRYSSIAIFHIIDVEEMYQAIKNCSNANLVKILKAFNSRYEFISTVSLSLLKNDRKNLWKLGRKLRSYAKSIHDMPVRKNNILNIRKEINKGYRRLVKLDQGKMKGRKRVKKPI